MSGAPRPRRALARIDLGAVARHCSRLLEAVDDGVALCAVVKADGYGHGGVQCAEAALAGGASMLAVAAPDEARELRASFANAPILVMGALAGDEIDIALAAGAEVAAWRPAHLRALAERAEAAGVRLRVHVKHDSGMGRLGEREPAAVEALARACAEDARLELAGLWTHFATADEADRGYLEEQLGRFTPLVERLRAEHPSLIVHAANSAATLRAPESHFDMVRCGIAIYGLDPFHRDPASHGLEPALELSSYVADVKWFERGASAGYGRRWRAPTDTQVGVLPIGYGDGVRRGLSNNADVLVGGRRHPLVGTISMDNVTIDLGPGTAVRPGESAILIGSQDGERILCEEVAERLGTINYEITCGISQRVPREYVQ
jgi:alanine racemase